MTPAGRLAQLRRELDGFAGCLHADLSVPVEHCGDWTLRDLAGHLGRGNLWAATAVTERHGKGGASPVPENPADLRAWFAETCEVLLTTLDTDPGTEAWTFYPPRTVGFWQRRRCHETLIHRWDAEHAAGAAGRLDPSLATDGVAEVFDTMAPRQITRGRLVPPTRAVGLSATDTGAAWTFGAGDPVAKVRGRAADLLLMLWGRLPADCPALTWEGDPDAGRAVLRGPLTP